MRKKIGKYLFVEKDNEVGIAYIISNKKEEMLGHISYLPSWKQWIYIPYDGTLYDTGCMKDIIKFMDGLK